MPEWRFDTLIELYFSTLKYTRGERNVVFVVRNAYKGNVMV